MTAGTAFAPIFTQLTGATNPFNFSFGPRAVILTAACRVCCYDRLARPIAAECQAADALCFGVGKSQPPC
jgi:hypothetical protein